LVSWTLDIDRGTIGLTWNSGMDISSLDASKITIQQNRTIGPPYNLMSYTLTSNSTSYSLDGPSVEVTVGSLDQYGYQAAYLMSQDKATTWLTMKTGAMLDLAGTPNQPIVDGNAMQVIINRAPGNYGGYNIAVVGFTSFLF
jgi:hypothetical protein